MNAIAPPTSDLAQLPPLPIYRFSTSQYQRLLDTGIVREESSQELRDGLLVSTGKSSLAPAITVLSPTASNGPQGPPVAVRRFSVEEYQRMVRENILGDDDPVELLEGWIVCKMPRNPPHDAVTSLLHNKSIGPKLPSGWFCRSQSAIVTETSEPEPDVAVVRGSERDYFEHHPGPQDMALVIEVADTTLQRDRKLKAPLYARARIPAYWIVNIPDRQVEVYTEPTGPDSEPAYRQRRDYDLADAVPLVIDGHEIGQVLVRDILP